MYMSDQYSKREPFFWLMQKWRIKWVQKMNTEQIKSRYERDLRQSEKDPECTLEVHLREDFIIWYMRL